MIEPFMLNCDTTVVLYWSADISSILMSSPFSTVAEVPTSIPFITKAQVLIVPVIVVLLVNHAMTIGFDL